MHGQVASLRCLVANGADINAVDDDGWRAIHRAAWVGDCPTLTALVELGAGVETACDAPGETSVHVAARNGRLKALRCLATELGANVAARDAFGRTAAHFAAWEGHVHMLRSRKSLGDLARRHRALERLELRRLRLEIAELLLARLPYKEAAV